MHRYRAGNYAMSTTAAPAPVTTGTAIKTMLQVATPATRRIRLIEWGFSSDDPPGADSIFELLDTDVAATVVAHVAAGVQPIDPGNPASLMTLGVAATGYTSSAEGTVAASRTHDLVTMSSVSAEAAPVLRYRNIFVPDSRPVIAVSRFLRVRVTTPTTAVDLITWVVWEE